MSQDKDEGGGGHVNDIIIQDINHNVFEMKQVKYTHATPLTSPVYNCSANSTTPAAAGTYKLDE